ncbi:MAG: GNAT family N-acetyltransferase [Halieaceae bacterium]
METIPIIRDGQATDIETLVDTLSDSFSSDPVMNWVIPRPQLYPDFFRLLVTDVYLPKGIVHLEDQGRGASLWLPPGEKFEIPPRLALLSMMARLVLRKGPGALLRIHQQGALFEKHHPAEPHFYLQFIGCRPRDQGRGVGSALLKEGTRLADEAGLPAYLESSNILNVPLYQRHGFEVIHEEDVAGGGPRVWFMLRPARTPN